MIDLEHFPRSGDDADMASVQSENDLKLALYRHKIDQHNDEVVASGFCAFCGAPVDSGKFCPKEDDYSCASEYHKRKEAEKRNGRV